MSKLKGVSLSVETIIIIVICILVLAVIVLFFTGVFNPAGKGITSEANLQKECNEWREHFYSNESFNCSSSPQNYPNLCNRFNKNYTEAKNYCTGGIE